MTKKVIKANSALLITMADDKGFAEMVINGRMKIKLDIEDIDDFIAVYSILDLYKKKNFFPKANSIYN